MSRAPRRRGSTAGAARKQVDQSKELVVQAHARAAEAVENAPRQVAIREANVAIRQAGAETANAQVEQNLLNLSYCKITAPVNGIIVKRTAEVGQHLSPGQQIFKEGDPGDGIYVIRTGLVQKSALLDNGERHVFSQVTPGDFFGEMALLSRRRRQADVVALGYCRVLVLSAADFRRFLRAYPRAKAEIDRIAEERTRANKEQAPV